MRAVVQRVAGCSVEVNRQIHDAIERGLLVYLGAERGDGLEDIRYLADKIINLRIFQDAEGKMNRSLLDTGYDLMVISQFTLCADTRKGRRPSFVNAEAPETAEVLYRQFNEYCSTRGVKPAEGVFQADMQVTYTNSGPVTIILDSKKRF
ncbi:MAG: D-tyrosyl-tRNA(Tyr) deacylase [Spirochaetales bacterium]|nr:D-tyrosyl-tRNA(Tyr) deacylase [Spirochaetales bacterium]